MDGIILKKIVVDGALIKYEFQCKGIIQDYFSTNEMFIQYETDMSSVPESILAIPFVSCVLPLMWLTDTVLWVDKIDWTFYEALVRIKEAYRNLYNHCPLKGNFVAARFEDNQYVPENENIPLFSGGMDAHTTYIRIHDTKPMLLNIQGRYGNLNQNRKDAAADFHDIDKFANENGLKRHFVKSNFAKLVKAEIFDRRLKPILKDGWWHGFLHSMAFISTAIPLAYLQKYRNIYIASSVPLGDYIVCASHVTTDSEFRFAGCGRCVHDGSELTRQEKAHVIAEYVRALKTDYPIRVCSFNDHNCCVCDKCFRSILGLTAECIDVRRMGFDIKGTLKEYFSKMMSESIIRINVKHEGDMYWPEIRERMKENYSRMNAEQKEFVDWFCNYDFVGERKKAIWKHYLRDSLKLICGRIGKWFGR